MKINKDTFLSLLQGVFKPLGDIKVNISKLSEKYYSLEVSRENRLLSSFLVEKEALAFQGALEIVAYINQKIGEKCLIVSKTWGGGR